MGNSEGLCQLKIVLAEELPNRGGNTVRVDRKTDQLFFLAQRHELSADDLPLLVSRIEDLLVRIGP